MTRSPRTVVSILLAAGLAALPLFAAASPALDAQRAAILRQRDPQAADLFLDDQGLQARLKAEDAKSELDLFRAATELRDLRQLLRGYDQEERVIRDGLAARPECSFCQDPKALLEWADKYRAAPRDFLRGALFEWDTMPKARAQWLAANGANQASWQLMPFSERAAKIKQWGKLQYDALMKAVPKDQAEMDALGLRASEANDALGHDEAYALGQRVEQAEAAVKAMAEAEKRLAKNASPEMLAALKAAKGAPDLETRLSQLGRIFDGLGVQNGALHAAAPLKPGQGFDEPTRRLAAEILGPALLRETDGTWAGAELKVFYAKTPMKITIKPEATGNLATYSDGVMNFGSGDIEDFLKGRGRAARDLLTDQALLHDLVRELAPVFVHEATHHRQDVWAKNLGISDSWSQYQELEAMQTESVYVLEKAARDPSYKAYLQKEAKTSPNAREAIGLAQRLETNGGDRFRRSIQALHYPGLVSLEGEVWSRIVKRNQTAGEVRAELARRDKLPAMTRTILQRGPALEEEYDSRAEFTAALRSAGTGKLGEFLKEADARDAKEPDSYAKHHQRLEEVNRLTELHLKELQAEANPAAPRRPVVPSPGGPR